MRTHFPLAASLWFLARSLSPSFSYLTNNKLKNYPKKSDSSCSVSLRRSIFSSFYYHSFPAAIFSCWALEKVGITLACFARLDSLPLSTCVSYVSVGPIPVLAEELSVLALSATKSRSRTDLNVSLCSLLSFQASNQG